MAEVPSPAAVPAAAVNALREQHEAEGIHVDPHTSTPGWLGERLDVGYAIDVLHPRADADANRSNTPEQ